MVADLDRKKSMVADPKKKCFKKALWANVTVFKVQREIFHEDRKDLLGFDYKSKVSILLYHRF